MRVIKIEWFYVSKWNRKPIWFLNNFIQFFMQYITTIRSSRSQMFFEIGVLKNFAMFKGKHLCRSLFFIKLQEHHRWLLLYIKLIGKLMANVNREIDDKHFHYNILCLLCLYHVSISSFRSSYRRSSVREVVLRNSTKFTG